MRAKGASDRTAAAPHIQSMCARHSGAKTRLPVMSTIIVITIIIMTAAAMMIIIAGATPYIPTYQGPDDTGSNMPYVAFADSPPPPHKHMYELGSYGMGAKGLFIYPQSADTDSEGNIYVTDLGNKRVQKFDQNGDFIISWGGHGKADGQFRYPSGIAVDGQYVYVADRDLNRIQKFDHNGNYISQWGGHGKTDGNMFMPSGMAVGDDGYLYVADTGNHRVQKFTTDGQFVLSIGGSGTDHGKFVIPHDVDISQDGSIYVSDRGNKRIDHIDADGAHIKSHKFEAPGSFDFIPDGIEIASEHYRISQNGAVIKDVMMYVTNTHSKRVLYLNMSESSEPLSTLGQFGPIRSGHMIFPTDILLAGGLLYVIDTLGHKIHVFATPEYVIPYVMHQVSEDESADVEDEPGSNDQLLQQPQHVVDSTPPVIVAPPDITVDATDVMTAVEIGMATATDEGGIRAILTNAPETFPIGISKITWIAFDNERNSAEAYQYVTVLACGQPRQAYDHYMTGTVSDDVINGTKYADIIFGHAGMDIINGGDGNDCIFGGGDDDIISGGDGSDYIVGGTGNDILRGDGGVDIIYGGPGADFFDGGGESDYCHQTDRLDLSVNCGHHKSVAK